MALSNSWPRHIFRKGVMARITSLVFAGFFAFGSVQAQVAEQPTEQAAPRSIEQSSEQSSQSEESPERTGPEEILVTGEQPGPGLWKIVKGDHAIWVLGTQS